jgi:4-carboxymuconolactone decarboxylase
MEQAKNNERVFALGNPASPDYFTGTAWVNILVPKDETGTYSIGSVVFGPGCRNNWHTHGAGQILIVTSGSGFYQQRGEQAKTIKKGDVIVIPSGIEHWHGASRDSSLEHLAITNNDENGPVTWLQPVTEEEYAAVHQKK